MLQARRSTIPGRKHKMVFVDFGNPYLRGYLAHGYCDAHRRHLDAIRARLPGWAADARASEAYSGRPPRPLAAVLDIDEVILCNIHMNSFQAPAGAQGPDPVDFHASDYFLGPDGNRWPREDLRLNPLLPGARDLLAEIRDLGIELFLITGRLESIRDETVENFIHVGLAGGPDRIIPIELITRRGGALIMCPDAERPLPGASIRPWKEGQRAVIDRTHRIIINVGDQISDLGLYGDSQIHCPHPYYWTP
jgi:predicted secreted acid phosphatase